MKQKNNNNKLTNKPKNNNTGNNNNKNNNNDNNVYARSKLKTTLQVLSKDVLKRKIKGPENYNGEQGQHTSAKMLCFRRSKNVYGTAKNLLF